MSLEVKDVTKFYGAQAALKNVNFSVKRGEIVGFLGPNGAGKSTMMKIITCYLPPSNGTVKVAGFDIFDDSLKVRKTIGYLPENNPLYPEMYIREYLRFVAGLYGIKRKKARTDDMIDMVGLGPESHKKIGQLSKGYRQRVGLAQALIHDPQVLILDEPTSGLDPNQLDDIRKLIQSIGREKTVLLSSHIMQEIEAICTRAIIIKLGEIVADGPVQSLKSVAQKEVFRVSLNKDIPSKRFSSLTGIEHVDTLAPGKFRIHAVKDAFNAKILADLASSENAQIEEFMREERNLEDVFKSLTK